MDNIEVEIFDFKTWRQGQTADRFSRKGLYMLATILKSPQATDAGFIIETFAKIRELSRTITALSATKKEFEQKPLLKRSGELVAELFDDLTPDPRHGNLDRTQFRCAESSTQSNAPETSGS